MEVEEKGLKRSTTEGGKEGNGKVIVSSNYLEEKFYRNAARDRDWALADRVDTLGLDVRTKTSEAVGSKRASKKE